MPEVANKTHMLLRRNITDWPPFAKSYIFLPVKLINLHVPTIFFFFFISEVEQ